MHLLALILLIFPVSAFPWGLKNLGQESAVPVTTDAKYVLIAGTITTVTLVIFEDAVIDPFQQKQVRNKTLGHSSQWGDFMGQWVPNLLYSGGMGLASLNGNSEGQRRAIGMLKASSYATAVTTALKYTIREPRPIDRHWRNSFPSGHSTTAFAFSGYVAAEHGWMWGLPATLLSAFVGYSRIQDNKHWLHDVVGGATIGWTYGWGISKLQKKKQADETTLTVLPFGDSGTFGLVASKEF